MKKIIFIIIFSFFLFFITNKTSAQLNYNNETVKLPQKTNLLLKQGANRMIRTGKKEKNIDSLYRKTIKYRKNTPHMIELWKYTKNNSVS